MRKQERLDDITLKETKRILLVEDNDEFARLASESLGKYSLERAVNYLEAADKIRKGSYDFYVIDGFFPYGATIPDEITDLVSAERALDGMPFEHYVDILSGEDSANLPLGALLARDLKNKGLDNYLICSAADHHSYSYRGLELLSQKWGLNLHLSDEAGKSIASKSTKEYWADVKKIVGMRD